MSVNASSPTNSSFNASASYCFRTTTAVLIGTAFSTTRIVVLLPLSIFVLYLGHRQWWRRRSFTAQSHSDIFTYHMAILELIWILGSILSFCSYSADIPEMMVVVFTLYSLSFSGQTFFHLLTCVERYLAVVHPITYLGLRGARGVRIRNISSGCVWLLSLLHSLLEDYSPSSRFSLFGPLVFSLAVVSYCSLSAFCVLIRPAPGDGGQDKERADQSKERACITIMVIMVVLWFWFGGLLVATALEVSLPPRHIVTCVVGSTVFWFNLPSSLVSPLLYLHRAGKRSCCCNNSGRR